MYYTKLIIATLFVAFACCSCQNDSDLSDSSTEQQEVKGTKNDIHLKAITPSSTTRADGELPKYTEAYRCSSEKSTLVADIYLSEKYDEAVTIILNKDLEPAYYLKFKMEGTDVDKATKFTAFNEFDEPIMSGKYNETKCYFEITDVYGNDVVTRASAASWGCNLSLWACGTIWSVAAGTASLGAGVVVGLAYTAAAVQICDGL